MKKYSTVSIQGHRGCRGLFPENSLEGFLYALLKGYKLELDIVISKDKKVVISHEPWLNHEFCLDLNGKSIKIEEEMSFNLYQMNYELIQKHDCGSKTHPRFPDQKKQFSYKPLLEELIDLVNNIGYSQQVWYNIEIKREAELDQLYYPKVDEYLDIVLELIYRKGIEKNCNLQSFDLEILQGLRQKAEAIPLAFLVENELSILENLDELGFAPPIYSPYYGLLNSENMHLLRKFGIKVIPWTVNSETAIQEMIALEVDEIISDYPDRVAALLL